MLQKKKHFRKQTDPNDECNFWSEWTIWLEARHMDTYMKSQLESSTLRPTCVTQEEGELQQWALADMKALSVAALEAC